MITKVVEKEVTVELPPTLLNLPPSIWLLCAPSRIPALDVVDGLCSLTSMIDKIDMYAVTSAILFRDWTCELTSSSSFSKRQSLGRSSMNSSALTLSRYIAHLVRMRSAMLRASWTKVASGRLECFHHKYRPSKHDRKIFKSIREHSVRS